MSSSNIHHLYLKHHRWLYRWLQGKLGHEGDAADIAQDTFLRMMHAFNGSPILMPRTTYKSQELI